MKYFLSLALVLFMATFGLSQTESASQELENTPDYIYCELIGVARAFSNKVTVSVDFGDEATTKAWSLNRLAGRDGKPIIFNSMVGALNYMGAQKWEFIQAYTDGVVNSGGTVHYIMKKKVSDLSPSEVKAFITQRKKRR